MGESSLVEMPAIKQLTHHCWRILGQNRGRYTLQGTNTYLIGTGQRRLLVDTGEGVPEYPSVLQQALDEASTVSAGPSKLFAHPVSISDILITHSHGDHFGGVSDVLHLAKQRRWAGTKSAAGGNGADGSGIRVWKLRSADAKTDWNIAKRCELVSLAEERHGDDDEQDSDDLPFSQEQLDSSFTWVKDGDEIAVEGARLVIHHTPGHTDDHICVRLEDPAETQASPILLTGDNILGQGTAVFTDLAEYLKSLDKMKTLCQDHKIDALFTGHGPDLQNATKVIQGYLSHRKDREAQVVATLQGKAPDEGQGVSRSWTPLQVVEIIYKDVHQDLWPAAAYGLIQILDKLVKEGRAVEVEGDDGERRFQLKTPGTGKKSAL